MSWRDRAQPATPIPAGSGWRSRAVPTGGVTQRSDGVYVKSVPQNGPRAPDDATTIPDDREQTTPLEAFVGSADLTDLGKRGSALISAAKGRSIGRSPSGQLREEYPAMVAPAMSLEGLQQRYDLYSQSLNALRDHYDQAKEEHPKTAFAGAVAPLLPLGALGLAETLGVGGTIGAVQSRNNPFEKPLAFGKDVATSTITSGLGYAGGKAIGGVASYGVRKIGDVLDDAAARPLSTVIPKDFGLTFGREFGEAAPNAAPSLVGNVAQQGTAVAPAGVSTATAQLLNAAKSQAQNIDSDPNSSLLGLLNRAMRFDTEGMNSQAEGLMMKYGPKIDRALKNIGVDAPTPTKWVSRDFDITQAQRTKLREKNLLGVAEDAILNHPDYAKIRTGEDKVKLVSRMRDEAGRKIGEFADMLDAESGAAGRTFNPTAVAQRISEEVLEPLQRHGTDLDNPTVRAVASQVRALAKKGNSMSFSDAFARIRQLDEHLSWDSKTDAPVKNALRAVRGIMKQESEDAAEAVAKKAQSPEAFEQWKQLKTQFGALREFEKMASKRLLDARDGNRFFSLTDNIWGAGALGVGSGLVAGSPTAMATAAAGALGMAGNKWARERGPQMMALSLQKHGWEAVQKAATENPNLLGPYARTIQESISRGGVPAALAIHNALMSRSPEYAQRVIGLAEESAKQSLAR